MKKEIFIVSILFLFLIVKPIFPWDDYALLTSVSPQLKPNLMFILDNSGSMNTVVFPPFYDPNHTYIGPGCDFINPLESYKIKKYYDHYYFVLSNNEYNNLYQLDEVPGNTSLSELNLGDCPDDGYVPNQGVYFYPLEDAWQKPRYPGNLLNFLLYYATSHQISIWNHFMIYGNFDAGQGEEISPGIYNPAPSVDGGDNTSPEIADEFGYTGHDNKIRIKAARKVLTRILWDIYSSWELDPNPDKNRPRVGISIFDQAADPDGGIIIQKCQDTAEFATLSANIKGISATSWTPLAECYAETWSYFRHGCQSQIVDPRYFLPLDNPSCQEIFPDKPITNWCQLNFIIVLTDGESTQDDYLRTLSTINPQILFNTNNVSSWGDDDGPGADDDTATLASNGTNYLDDLAYFAYESDLFPDDILQNDASFEQVFQNQQFIYTYTIGFAIDNYLLEQTAHNGGGNYYVASNYNELLDAFRNAISGIDEKVNSYSAFAAPKYSTFIQGAKGYIATFIPRNTRTIWEGHLKCFLLDYEGNFPSDLNNPGQIQVYDDNGNLVPVDSFQWDAGVKLNERTTEREIYTVVDSVLVPFTETYVNASSLGCDCGDEIQDQADCTAVINFIRGDNTGNWPLGDIFHFPPVVVGAPLRWKAEFDYTYQQFYEHWTEIIDGKRVSKRPEVVYAGANDGMLHCFRVDTGEELWAFIPPSLLSKLKHCVPGVTGSLDEHRSFVDGQAIAKDIKIDDNGDYKDWRTVLIFGLGNGGQSYCALDATDPENPQFLWEFTRPEFMGYTEAKPIAISIGNDGDGNAAPVVILSGGLDENELPSQGENAEDTTSLTGKSFYVVHAYTGNLIKQFLYGPTTSNPDTVSEGICTHTNASFNYSFVATPVAIDSQNDGIADYFYVFESGDFKGTAGEGGRVWRIDLDGPPISWRPKNIFQAADGQTIFLPATVGYDNSYNTWLFMGTGHRSDPIDSTNRTGQFIGFVDNNTISIPIENGDLKDISSLFSGIASQSDFSLTTHRGFYFDFPNSEGEILIEPYPVFLDYEMIFNTFAPGRQSSSSGEIDPCNPPGNQFLYRFFLNTTAGITNINDPIVESGRIHGYGSLTGGKYKVYSGEGEIGNLQIKKQDTVDLTNIFGPMFWLESKK